MTGLQRPGFRTINDFRKRHLAALAALFVQVLRLCRAAGLVKLGHVALDGTKLKANASKHKAMSYRRMARAEAELTAEVAGWLEQAEREDAADDIAYGADQRGEELPEWVKDKQQRLERLRAAKAALEAEAAQPPPVDAEPGPSSGMSDRGRPRRAPDGGPPARAQRNFTDPDSRVLRTRDGFVQGYNGQLAVDAAHQIIVAQRLTTHGGDQEGLAPLLEATTAALGRTPREVSADAGFCRGSNLAALAARGIRGYLAPGRASHGSADPSGRRRLKPASQMAKMAAKLKRAGRRSRYRLRKQTVEPVIGQIKHARGFRQFLLRGFSQVKNEWAARLYRPQPRQARRRPDCLSRRPPQPNPSCHAKPKPHPSVPITSTVPPPHFPDRLLGHNGQFLMGMVLVGLVLPPIAPTKPLPALSPNLHRASDGGRDTHSAPKSKPQVYRLLAQPRVERRDAPEPAAQLAGDRAGVLRAPDHARREQHQELGAVQTPAPGAE